MNIFQVIYSPRPLSLPSFGSSPDGYHNSFRFRGFSCFFASFGSTGFRYFASLELSPPPTNIGNPLSIPIAVNLENEAVTEESDPVTGQ